MIQKMMMSLFCIFLYLSKDTKISGGVEMKIQGPIKVGTKTKILTHYLGSGEIAVIQHDDIDELAAEALISTDIKAIINTGRSMTGKFLSLGTKAIYESNIKLIDTILPIKHFKDNDIVTVVNKDIIINNKLYKDVCTLVNSRYIMQKKAESVTNQTAEILKFIENTILYADKEKEKITYFSDFPELNINLKGKHVLIVVRNSSSFDEIQSLKSYIDNCKPVLIGVDGGADILNKCGYIPDILIGDMDSVSDIGMYRSKELVLHAYENGKCPCLERVRRLNIPYKVITITGTSEDAALMLAYRKEAELIVLVGGHCCMYDFMRKGRAGMGSTLITRLIVGDKLVDCKGINRLLTKENIRKEFLWAKM
jgi:uncharacterized membrane-anchored protein